MPLKADEDRPPLPFFFTFGLHHLSPYLSSSSPATHSPSAATVFRLSVPGFAKAPPPMFTGEHCQAISSAFRPNLCCGHTPPPCFCILSSPSCWSAAGILGVEAVVAATSPSSVSCASARHGSELTCASLSPSAWAVLAGFATGPGHVRKVLGQNRPVHCSYVYPLPNFVF
jgi:hypothetical protein